MNSYVWQMYLERHRFSETNGKILYRLFVSSWENWREIPTTSL